MLTPSSPTTPLDTPVSSSRTAPVADITRTAQDFEAAILAELLKATGIDSPGTTFGGGIGEEQFSSFLLEARAQAMAARGGIGLAEMVLRSGSLNTLPEGNTP